jgi:hypothetical protein
VGVSDVAVSKVHADGPTTTDGLCAALLVGGLERDRDLAGHHRALTDRFAGAPGDDKGSTASSRT